MKTKNAIFLIFVSCFVFYILLWFAQFFSSFIFLIRSIDQIVKFNSIDWLISSHRNVFKFLYDHEPLFLFQSEVSVMFQSNYPESSACSTHFFRSFKQSDCSIQLNRLIIIKVVEIFAIFLSSLTRFSVSIRNICYASIQLNWLVEGFACFNPKQLSCLWDCEWIGKNWKTWFQIVQALKQNFSDI